MAPVLGTGGSAGISSPEAVSTETASTGQTGTNAAQNNVLDKMEKVANILNKFN